MADERIFDFSRPLSGLPGAERYGDFISFGPNCAPVDDHRPPSGTEDFYGYAAMSAAETMDHLLRGWLVGDVNVDDLRRRAVEIVTHTDALALRLATDE